MLKKIKEKNFANGIVYLLETKDGYKVETTDSFLPYYTKECINQSNMLADYELGSRLERWMIGVSVMSGCPVGCKFCATGNMKKYKNLTAQEIAAQVDFVIKQNPKYRFDKAKEYKINYTRMGEPFLNIENVKGAIDIIEKKYPGTHHYISTVGIKDSDFSWIQKNITLQISVHSLDEEKRDWLIPYSKKMSLESLGQIRTQSNLKTTVNMTLVDEKDFSIDVLKGLFSNDNFFIKLSPINPNEFSLGNGLKQGAVEGVNLL